MNYKKILREEIKRKRSELPEQVRRQKSRAISEYIQHSSFFPAADKILFFAPAFGEPDILQLAEMFITRKTIAFPRVSQENLLFKEVQSVTELSRGSFGIMEPSADLPDVNPNAFDLVFVPALAIDKKGNRLGFGGGYYDRFLRNILIQKIGVIFDFQKFDELPMESFDIPVDGFVTESGIKKIED